MDKFKLHLLIFKRPNFTFEWFLIEKPNKLTAYELQAVDEFHLLGCVQVKMSEGGIGSEREALKVFYGLHEPGGGETHTVNRGMSTSRTWPVTSADSLQVPVVGDSGSLNEAGGISLFEQLLCVGHQACMFQQATPLRDLSRQDFLSSTARSLQGQDQSPLTLGHSCSQLPDTVGELLQSCCTVSL